MKKEKSSKAQEEDAFVEKSAVYAWICREGGKKFRLSRLRPIKGRPNKVQSEEGGKGWTLFPEEKKKKGRRTFLR